MWQKVWVLRKWFSPEVHLHQASKYASKGTNTSVHTQNNDSVFTGGHSDAISILLLTRFPLSTHSLPSLTYFPFPHSLISLFPSVWRHFHSLTHLLFPFHSLTSLTHSLIFLPCDAISTHSLTHSLSPFHSLTRFPLSFPFLDRLPYRRLPFLSPLPSSVFFSTFLVT